MRRFLFLGVTLLALVTTGVAIAGTNGNSANAKLCQKNGWRSLYTSTGSSFASEEACVAYAAGGGTLGTKTKSQLDCEALGGTFSTDPSTERVFGPTGAPGPVLWTCNDTNVQAASLAGDCQLTPGGHWTAFSDPPYANTCWQS